MFSAFTYSNFTNDSCLQKIVQSGWLGSNQRYFSYTDGSGRGMVALQRRRRRRGVHVRRGGGARRGCYIAPFTFLHQAIVLRHGPFWHNHNVIIITAAAAAFAATAPCLKWVLRGHFLENKMQKQKLDNGFCIDRDLLSLGWLGYSKNTKMGQNTGNFTSTAQQFHFTKKSTKNSFQHTVPPRVWLGSMIPSAFLHQRYEVLVIIRVDGWDLFSKAGHFSEKLFGTKKPRSFDELFEPPKVRSHTRAGV